MARRRQRIVEMMGHLMRTNTRAMDVLSQLGDGRFAILLSGVGLATGHARMGDRAGPAPPR